MENTLSCIDDKF
uniref:Uncharacterized protein n=1 Tax=Anguilla anguilla TaxID=7936 RepID=A0A0E9QK56_ANGAN